MMTLALSDSAALGLVGVLFAPVEMPIVYFCTRRAIQSWRRWAQ
ncbi:hypothetical protein [Streptomyces sp. NPDC088847]